MQLIGLDEQFFRKILQDEKVGKLKNVLVLTADGTGKIYLQVKKRKYKTLRVEYPDGKTW